MSKTAQTLLGPWRLMPRIQEVTGVRVPRAGSYSFERDSGRVLTALRWPRIRVAKPLVYIRNVHRQHAKGELRIENMREFDGLWNRLRVHETGKTNVYCQATRLRKSRYTSWDVLKARGWEMVVEPFLLEQPMHNCMLELAEEEFLAIHQTHRNNDRNSVEAYHGIDTADETPTSRLIAMHYQSLGVTQGWTPERVKRLAATWQMTIRELARYILCAPGRIEDFVEGTNAVELPGSVMLWLFQMERLAEQQFFGRAPTTPLFPQLSKAS